MGILNDILLKRNEIETTNHNFSYKIVQAMEFIIKYELLWISNYAVQQWSYHSSTLIKLLENQCKTSKAQIYITNVLSYIILIKLWNIAELHFKHFFSKQVSIFIHNV